MGLLTDQIDFLKHILRVIIVASITGGLLVIVLDNFWGAVREFLSKDPVAVSAVIERVEFSAKKKFDGSRHLTSAYYSLGLECVYSFGGKSYMFIEGHRTDKDGQLFSSLMPLIELSQNLSPRQPITLYGKSYFDRNEKTLLSNQEFHKGVKGTRILTISKKSPDLVIRNSSKKIKAILVPIFCMVIFLGFAFYLAYLPFKKSTPTQATILLLIVSLCGYGAIVLSSKWFWRGGTNTKIYDPNKPIDPESLTIYKNMPPSELNPE